MKQAKQKSANRTAVILLLLSAVTLVTGVALYSPRAAVLVAAAVLLAAGLANLEARERK